MSAHKRIPALIGLLCAAGLLVCSAVPLSAASGASSSTPLGDAWLVADVNPFNGGSEPKNLKVLNGNLLLAACTGLYQGYYLIDSPSAEPLLLTNSRTSLLNCQDLPDPNFSWFNGRLFFVVDKIESGAELWESDGTPEGTHIFKDLTPGAAGSSPDRLTVAGNWLYFTTGYIGGTTFQLMRTDGSPEHVQQVANLIGNSSGISLTAFGSNLLFTTRQITYEPFSLWITSGTPETTQILLDPTGPVFSDPLNLTPGKGPGGEDWLYFSAYDYLHGQELWRTDGTPAGTRLVKDFTPGVGGNFPGEMVYANGALYLAIGDASHHEALWRTNGSEASSQLVSPIPPDGSIYSPALQEFTVFNGKIYFTAYGQAGLQVWRTDGTATGTTQVTDLPYGLYSNGPYDLTVSDSRLFFAAHTNQDIGSYQAELWNITAQEQAAELAVFPDCGIYLSNDPRNKLQDLTDFNGQLFFAACDYPHADELWTYDETQGGARLAFDFNKLGYRSFVNSLAKLNGRYFFSADDEIRTPGGNPDYMFSVSTAPGSLQPLLSRTGTRIHESSGPVTVGDSIFFVGSAVDSSESGLFRSDGTPAGTLSILPSGKINGVPVVYHPFRDSILIFDNFSTYTDQGIKETVNIWKTNGQPGGSELVASLPDPSYISGARVCDLYGAVYFAVNQNDKAEIWRTDGTAEGTQVVVSLTGRFDWDRTLVPTSQRLFFYLSTGGGDELWQWDGTQAGAGLVMAADPDPSDYIDLGTRTSTVIGDTLFFIAISPEGEYRLMKTQGAAYGVEEVHNFGPQTWQTAPNYFTPLDNTAYFCSGNWQEGLHIWRTDGTPDGTYPLISASNPYQGCAGLIQRGGRLFFSASTPDTGAELWTSLGSPEDIRLVADINPGPDGSDPYALDSANGMVLIQADTPEYGVEIWAVDLGTNRFYLPLISR